MYLVTITCYAHHVDPSNQRKIEKGATPTKGKVEWPYLEKNNHVFKDSFGVKELEKHFHPMLKVHIQLLFTSAQNQ